MKKYFAHKTAELEKLAKIGDGTKIWHLCHITNTAQIGKDCSLGRNCYVAGVVGNNCRIQNNVNIYQGVVLEDYVFCGPSMTFTNITTPRVKYPKNGNYEKTIVKSGSSIGAHATILPGITLGQSSLIGAGSVVTKDVPDYALVYGNPAKIHGWICECGTKLPEDFKKTQCSVCQKNYQKKGDFVTQSL